ncbi:MAG: T9SS type A sorting domain-containing protein [bacterium]
MFTIKTRFFVCLLATQLIGQASFAQTPGVWETSGPFKNIVINDLIVEPTNPSRVYLGSLGQGVFFSTNGGINWTQANAPMNDKTVFTLLWVEGTLYAGTVREGVFRSTDGGQNWTQANAPMNDKIINVLLPVGETLYAGTSRDGVFLSTNGGVDWIQANPPLDDKFILTLISVTDTLYAGTFRDGVFRSTDGINWTQANAPMNDKIITVLISIDDKLLAGTSRAGVYFSIDGGIEWTQANAPMNDKDVFTLISVDGILFAGTQSGGVFLSTDGGVNWVQANPPMNDKWTTALLSVDGTLYAGTVPDGVFISRDGGINWTQANPPMNNREVAKLLSAGEVVYAVTLTGVFNTGLGENNWFPAGQIRDTEFMEGLLIDKKFIIAYGNGAFRSTDGGSTWTPANSPMDVSQVQTMIMADGILVAGTTFDGVFHSLDGINWTQANSPLNDKTVETLAFVKPTLYAGTIRDGLFSSTDGGSNWTQANPPLNDKFITAITSTNNTLIAGTSGNGIFISSNGGGNWLQANPPMNDKAIQTLVSVDGKLYSGTLGDGVFRSTDAGINWTQANPPMNDKRITSLIAADGLLFAGTTEFGVFHSTDGMNWQPSDASLNQKSVETIVSVNGALYAATTEHGVFRSKDEGVHWTPLNTGLKADFINQFTYLPILNRLYAAGDGVFSQRLDLLPPEALSVNLTNQAAFTSERDISLILQAEQADSMALAEDSTFTDIPWLEAQVLTDFTLSRGDGEKTIYARFKDFSWNESAVVSTGVILDSTPPRFQTHTPPPSALLGQPVTLNQAVDEDNLQNIELFFRRAGEPFTQNRRVIFDEGSAEIDSVFISNRGLDYRIVATDLAGQSDTLRNGNLDFFSLPVVLNVGQLGSSPGLPSGTGGSAFRMVSIPMKLTGQPSVTSVFGDLGKNGPDGDWLLWSYDNGTWNQDATTTLETARSYFLLLRKGRTLSNRVAGITMETTAGLLSEIPAWNLRANDWTLIGNPYNTEIELRQLKLANQNLLLATPDPAFQVWAYDGRSENSGWTNENIALEPWGGLAVFVTQADTIVFSNDFDPFAPPRLGLPKSNSPAYPAIPNQSDGEWLVQVRGDIPGFSDRVNIFGVRKEARVEQDAYDWVEPPMLPGGVSISFPHPEWETSLSFASDIRPMTGDGTQWPLKVVAKPGAVVSVTFDNLATLPEKLAVFLIDEETQLIRNLQEQPQISIRIPHEKNFKLMTIVVGDPEFVQHHTNGFSPIPTRFMLRQNYPNPFNPTTVIRYELPIAGEVTLEVFDLLGRMVTTIEDNQHRGAGFYESVVDLGRHGSGVYFYRLTVQGAKKFTQTQKMLLVK